MEYPQYRKYKNIDTFFLVLNAKEFEEIKVMGSKYVISKVEAIQYPEQLLIQDMLENREGRWETVSEIDFLKKIKEIRKTKTKIG